MLFRNCNYIIVFKVSFIAYLAYYLTLALVVVFFFVVVVFCHNQPTFCPTVLNFGLNFCFN